MFWIAACFALGEAYAVSAANSVLAAGLMAILTVAAVSVCIWAHHGGDRSALSGREKLSRFLLYVVVMLMAAGVGRMNISTMEKQEAFAKSLGDERCSRLIAKAYDIREGKSGYQVYIYAYRVETETAVYEGKTRLVLYMDDVSGIKLGQRMGLTADISRPAAATNPGAYDARSSNAAKGIYMTGRNVTVCDVEDGYSHIRQWLYTVRLRAGENLSLAMDEADASVARAMLLGEKSGLDSDTKKLFQMNGIAHILAISGIHVAIIGMTLFNLIRRLSGSYPAAACLAVAVVIMYGVMTGMASSTFRAVIMMVISMGGRTLGRSTDMLTSAGTAAVIQAMVDPYIMMDAGFQLSFGAVAGMAVYGSLIDRIARAVSKNGTHKLLPDGRLSHFFRNFMDTLKINVSVTLATTPITIYYFYQFPLYSILLNLVIVPLASFIIFLSIGVMAFGMWSLDISTYVALPVELMLDFYRFMCRLFLMLPHSNINVGHISVVMIAVFYAAVLTVLYLLARAAEIKLKNRRLMCICGAVCITAVCACYEGVVLDRGFAVVFMDVGQGDGIMIRTGEGTGILIDGGSSDESGVGEYIISPVLKYYGCAEIEYAFVTHGDTDHISGIEYILGTENTGITIRNLVLPRYGSQEELSELVTLADAAGVNVMYMEAGGALSGESGFRLDYLYPGDDTGLTDVNDLSAVIRLTSGNLSILFTGDLGSEGEKLLLSDRDTCENCTDVDILKVGHHGSRYSSSEEFLAVVSPEYAVISAGRDNMYGHPHDETLQRLEAAEAETICTADSGAVAVTFMQGGDINVEAYTESD